MELLAVAVAAPAPALVWAAVLARRPAAACWAPRGTAACAWKAGRCPTGQGAVAAAAEVVQRGRPCPAEPTAGAGAGAALRPPGPRAGSVPGPLPGPPRRAPASAGAAFAAAAP